MAAVSPIFGSFNAGELSPILEGRTDYDKYAKGLRSCENFIPLVQGPLTRRPGTFFVSPVKDSTKSTRIVSFEFSTTQAYIIEFGDLYLRFYRNNGIVTQTAQNITGITAANPGVVTYSGSDTYANGDKVLISGVVGMVQVNNREFTVANVNAGANTFELSGVDTSAYTAYASGGTVAEIYEVVTPFVEADLFELQFAQSNDVLYIAHPSYAPRKLSRTAHTAWTLTAIAFLDGPYLNTNTTTTTLALSGTTGSVTVTASSTTGINDGAGFSASDVGRVIRWHNAAAGTIYAWMEITAYTSSTVVTALIKRTSSGTAATTDWRLGAWAGANGYPGSVTFYGDRLYWGGVTAYPQRLDGSNVGDYENMAPSAYDGGAIADDNAVTFTLNANNTNVIRWLIDSDRGLLAGTAGGEWLIRPSSANEALTPTNIQATRSTGYGCAALPPLRVGRAVLFVQRNGRKVRELAYMFEDDGLRAPDMTIAAEHITRGGVVDAAYQAQPQSIAWFVRADGVLLGFTYEREQETIAWHRHIIGGAFGSGDAVVESVAVIPDQTGAYDQLWLVVKRTIDGATKRYIEYVDKLWDESRDQEDAHFVDAGLVYDGTPATTITGLWHLNGESVTVLADGAAHPNKTVSSGAITLNRSASVVHVGYGYVSSGQTERMEAGSRAGTAQGKRKRISNLVARFWETLGDWKFGSSSSGTLEEVTFRRYGDDLGVAPSLYEGDADITFPGGYETDGRIYFQVQQPFPGTLLAIVADVRTEG